MIKASDKEWELAESTANEIQCRIQKYFIESVNPKYTQFCKVEVLVPVTENINMEFMIDVPKEMMDEDNSTLLEYFVNHIYKPEDKYMTESINEAIAERDAAALRLEENLKNFDSEAFFNECEEDFVMRLFGINPDPPCPVSTTFPTDFDGDILEMSIEDDDDKYLTEMVIGHDTPIRWKIVNKKIHITGKVSVVDRKTEVEYYIVKGSDITSIYVFAGKGSKKIFRNAWLYVKKYGGEEKDWFHARGKCIISVNGDQFEVDLHWCENQSVGAVSREIKEWYGMNDQRDNMETCMNEYGVLNEDGIILENGKTIKDGKVVELARRCQELIKADKFDEFMDLICDDPEVRNLPDDQIRLLLGTKVTDKNMNLLEMSFHIEVMNSPDVPEE